MTDTTFLPIILGSDENAYGTARLFHDEYGIKPLLVCTRQLIPTLYSKLFTLIRVDDFDLDEVFVSKLSEILTEYSKKFDKLLVIPCSDYYAAMLSRHYGAFGGMIANRVIPESLLDALDTKDKFYALCDAHGMDYPATVVVTPEERLTAADSLPFGFPIVVKPENSNATDYLHAKFEGKKKVFFFNSKDEYVKVVESMNASDYKGKLIIQEFIEGTDEEMRVVNSYSDSEGKVRAMCLGQPVLEEYAPKTLGNYAAIISRSDASLYKKVKKFLEDIGYVGFSNIDIKYDRRNDRFVMFEINPRLGRSSYFVRGAGINMMKMLVDDAVYGKTHDCVFADNTSIWLNVPKKVISEYVKDEKLRDEAKALIKEGKYSRTLDRPAERSLRRWIWVKRYYMGQHNNFKRYFFDKDGAKK
ncbi:MAG: ATP-grasp domain-containing protein [Clostridia bacterium]|nr:ATP-grasp domain-containing protein [Clostridia bacterium]